MPIHVDDLVEQIIERVKASPPELIEEIKGTVRKIKKGDGIADVDMNVPTNTLEAYLKQK